jgi:hypothetical protein
VARPFEVTSTTPKVAFVIRFQPNGQRRGAVSYVYSFPSLGQSHHARGSYKLSKPEPEGTLHLALKASDHVVFDGFGGNIPMRHKFDLVPSADTGCLAS